jgi:integrase
MARTKLTRRVVERLPAPDPSGKQRLHWDELSGFGVLCSGTTTVKTYVVQHRVNGLNRRVTVARCDVIDVDEARDRAQLVIAGMYQGVDPKRPPKPSAGTLRQTLDAYLKAKKSLRPASRKKYRCIERYLADWLDRPLRDITREMVEDRHALIKGRVEREKASRLASGAATANDTMLLLGILWRFAADRDETLSRNPVRLRDQQYPVSPRTGSVPAEKMGEWCRAVEPLPNHWRDYVMLLLYTGMRRREAAALRWSEVDMALRVIRLPATRTKAGRPLDLPMSDQVFSILASRRADGIDSSGFVFPGRGRSGHIEKVEETMAKLAEQTGMTIRAHDLRRTFLTVADSVDVSALALKALVNHTLGNSDVTANYVRMTAERLRGPAQRIADRIDELRRGVDKIIKLE